MDIDIPRRSTTCARSASAPKISDCVTAIFATSLAPSPSKTRKRTPSGTSAFCAGIFQNGCTGKELTISSNSAGSFSTAGFGREGTITFVTGGSAVLTTACTAWTSEGGGPGGGGRGARLTDATGTVLLVETASVGTVEDFAASSTSMSSSPRPDSPFSSPGATANLSAKESQDLAASGRTFKNISLASSLTAASAASSSKASISSLIIFNSHRYSNRAFVASPGAGGSISSLFTHR
mmetsp:Transcript_78129/g.121882  ORF Transcript_78129/g.121882 Transcript_78129/m.121882 type:complete len:237 (-) Transcript_78129:490-1200(-)